MSVAVAASEQEFHTLKAHLAPLHFHEPAHDRDVSLCRFQVQEWEWALLEDDHVLEELGHPDYRCSWVQGVVLVPVLVPALVPVLVPALVPALVPVLVPALVPVLVPALVPVLIPALVPVLVPAPAET